MGDVVGHDRAHHLRIVVQSREELSTFIQIEKPNLLSQVRFEQFAS